MVFRQVLTEPFTTPPMPIGYCGTESQVSLMSVLMSIETITAICRSRKSAAFVWHGRPTSKQSLEKASGHFPRRIRHLSA
jgi:hypothetical protein